MRKAVLSIISIVLIVQFSAYSNPFNLLPNDPPFVNDSAKIKHDISYAFSKTARNLTSLVSAKFLKKPQHNFAFAIAKRSYFDNSRKYTSRFEHAGISRNSARIISKAASPLMKNQHSANILLSSTLFKTKSKVQNYLAQSIENILKNRLRIGIKQTHFVLYPEARKRAKPKPEIDSTFIVVVTDPLADYTPNEFFLSECPEQHNIDSLLNQWYLTHEPFCDTLDFEITANDSTYILADSIYIQRINQIPAIIDLAYNKTVKREIIRYTRPSWKKYVEPLIGRAEYYFPMFEEILDLYGLPIELKYLPIIESAINPRAVSRAGATGMWQFMYSTGKFYDLKINSYVDERRDPVKATHAAARYFLNMYDRYGDWTLALAAYNCGPGNVNRAIRRSGKNTYWGIYDYLPRETRGYVPRYIAVAYLMNYYHQHDMVAQRYEMPQITDTVMISGNVLKLNQVSEVLGIPEKQLKDLNPQYKRGVIPATKNDYALTLPFCYTTQFIEKKDSILTYKPGNNRQTASAVKPNTYKAYSSTKNKSKVVYTVKSGDSVGLIAQWFGVSSSDIKYWNNMYNNKIIVGDKLVIYVPKDKADVYKRLNYMNYDQKQQFAGKGTNRNETTTVKLKSGQSNNDYVYYRIKKGDNFWNIAKRYPDVTCKDILEINNFSKNTRINPGDIIKIKRK